MFQRFFHASKSFRFCLTVFSLVSSYHHVLCCLLVPVPVQPQISTALDKASFILYQQLSSTAPNKASFIFYQQLSILCVSIFGSAIAAENNCSSFYLVKWFVSFNFLRHFGTSRGCGHVFISLFYWDSHSLYLVTFFNNPSIILFAKDVIFLEEWCACFLCNKFSVRFVEKSISNG